MRNLRNQLPTFRVWFCALVLLGGLCMVATLTQRSTATASQLSVTVVNNAGWEIRHLYLSPADSDDWGPDQLDSTPIGSGSSRTIQVTWEQSTVKLVAEDQDGCFVNTTIDATGSPQWTITSSTARDCGTSQ